MNIALFYLHGNYVMEYAKDLQFVKSIRLFAFIVGEIIIYCLTAMATNLILLYVFAEQPESGLKFNIAYFAVVIYRALFFITFGTGYYFLRQYLIRKELEMLRIIEVEKLQTQLLRTQKDYLRAQINPHLLFNTLDFIKAVSKKNPEQSDKAIDCLSEIMDYALETSHKDLVSLDRELEQIEHIIQLNFLRSNNRLNISFIKKIDYAESKIIPIVLLTLVENVFKHGNLLDPEHLATIELLVNNKSIIFRTRNLIASMPPSKSERTGLKNITARLMQSYPEKHQFCYSEAKNIFTTELKISL